MSFVARFQWKVTWPVHSTAFRSTPPRTLRSSCTRQFAIWGENNPSSLSIPFLAIGLIAAGDSARNVKYPQTACPHVSFRPKDLIEGMEFMLGFTSWVGRCFVIFIMLAVWGSPAVAATCSVVGAHHPSDAEDAFLHSDYDRAVVLYQAQLQQKPNDPTLIAGLAELLLDDKK